MTTTPSIPTHTPDYTVADVRGTVKLVSRTGNPLLELKPASAEGGAHYDELVRLIAAAPELLDTMRKLVAWADYVFSDSDNPAWDTARALLAKIGG